MLSAIEIIIRSTVRSLNKQKVSVDANVLNIAIKEAINDMIFNGGAISASHLSKRYKDLIKMFNTYENNDRGVFWSHSRQNK